jgi:asparagine N-glycosylation enzyme membrane subunit Stt3
MLDFNALFEFSRANCIAICAFLVPANLLLTLRTIVFTGLSRPQVQVRQAAVLACIPALVMILHVWTWFLIGVIMAPTFILLWLASTCLGINFWAITYPQSLVRLLSALFVMLPFELSTSLRK